LFALAWVAAPATAYAGLGGARANTAANSPFATQIGELRAARALLEQADHDYNGHRAEAVKLVTAAIHALRPPQANGAHSRAHAHTGATKNVAVKQTAKNGNSLPQAASDALLKQAMGQIATVQTQLAGAGGAAPGGAGTSLQQAVQELKTALSIK
jgi:hypothetical protein